MRSLVLAAWFSVAATGALASDAKAPVVAAETTRSSVTARHASQELAGPGLAAAQVAARTPRPVDSRLPLIPAGTALEPAPVLLAAGPRHPIHLEGRAGTIDGTGPDGEVSQGSLTAAALLMMAVVMFRRRGRVRRL